MTTTSAMADEPKEIFEKMAPATVQVVTEEAFGTGFIYNADKGLIATNAHVVAGQSSFKVRIGDQEPVPVRLMGVDPCEDLAVVKLQTPRKDLKQVKFGDSEDLGQGDEVTAIGYPVGAGDISREKAVLTTGVVQSPEVAATGYPSEPDLPSTVQHSATLNQGNSGGPLFNADAELVGVNTFAAGGTEGQYNSISSEHAEPVLRELARGKSKNNPGWGDLVAVSDPAFPYYFAEEDQTSAQDLQQRLQNEEIDGLYVMNVSSNTPASDARLAAGDIITHIKDSAVSTDPEVCGILQSSTAGEKLSVDGVFTESGTFEDGTPYEFGDPWLIDMTLEE